MAFLTSLRAETPEAIPAPEETPRAPLNGHGHADTSVAPAELGSDLERPRETLRARLERALEVADEREIRRVGHAGTSVTFEIAGAQHETVTMLIDRNPPRVVDGSEPAEVSITLTGEQAERFSRGQLILPALLLSGEIPYRGPARKYLVVDPILRQLLSRGLIPDDEL